MTKSYNLFQPAARPPPRGLPPSQAHLTGPGQAPQVAGGAGAASAHGDLRQERTPRGGAVHPAAVRQAPQAAGECAASQVFYLFFCNSIWCDQNLSCLEDLCQYWQKQ